jgi:acetyl-CoA synthetase
MPLRANAKVVRPKNGFRRPAFHLLHERLYRQTQGVVHTHGGYMVYTEYTFRNVFQYQDGEIFWCTADVGWITGHSYIIYGPLLAGATSLMFEGVPTFPDAGRFWDVIKRHKVNIFYTAPTAIRALMAAGDRWVKNRRMPSLRVLGTVGEPINEEAWNWYNEKSAKNAVPSSTPGGKPRRAASSLHPSQGLRPPNLVLPHCLCPAFNLCWWIPTVKNCLEMM